jgi:HSP20 family protein
MHEVGLRELARIRERLDRLFEKGLSGAGLGFTLASDPWEPPVDVVETEEAFHLTFEIAGLTREQLDLHLDRNRLVLQGCRDGLGEGRHYLRMERSHGSFRREVELGGSLDPDGVEAKLAKGLLTVRVAKQKGRTVGIRSLGDEA